MLPHGQIIDLTHSINDSIATYDAIGGFEMKITLDYADCTTPLNLETAIGPRQKVQDFESESLTIGVEHSQKVKATPSVSDYGSKDCTFCPDPTAVSRLKFRVQHFSTPSGIGTHIDAPAHCETGGLCVADIPLTQLMAPAVVINVSQQASQDYAVSVQDILSFENLHGTIPSGTFAIVYTGWSGRWHSPSAYRNVDDHEIKHFPTVSPEAANLLFERGVVGIGIDTLSPDAEGKEHYVHKLFLQGKKYIVENIANADQLPPVGAFVIILPMKIDKGTEAPVRMIAMIP
jgi:kynurenine formamidase